MSQSHGDHFAKDITGRMHHPAMLTGLSLLLSGVLLGSLEATPTQHPRGVSPKLAPFYSTVNVTTSAKNALFKCLDGNGQSIPWSSVNDDYCDCADGSDEPGTSACSVVGPVTSNSPPRFWCVNSGHRGAYLPSSRVNDGVCDPTCCDGSDETTSAIQCPNVCAQAKRSHTERMTQLQSAHSQGIKMKLRSQEYGLKERSKRAASRKRIMESMTPLREQIETVERVVNASRELERASACYRAQELNTFLQGKVDAALGQWDQLQRVLDEAKHAFHPGDNFGDDVDAAPVHEPVDLSLLESKVNELQSLVYGVKNELSKLSPSYATASSPPDSGNDTDVPSFTILHHLSHLLDCINPSQFGECWNSFTEYSHSKLSVVKRVVRQGWRRGHEYVRAILGIPLSEELVKEVMDELASLDAASAKLKLEELQKQLETLDKELEEIEAMAGKNFGSNGEWEQYYKTCVELEHQSYTYKLCFMDDAYQNSVHLGSFTRFGGREDVAAPYSNRFMMYEGGSRCWNGPERSVQVRLECGIENQLLSMSEPNKCAYEFVIASPMACDEETLARLNVEWNTPFLG